MDNNNNATEELFPQSNRVGRKTTSTNSYNHYDNYQNSDREEIVNFKKLLNQWFSNYPTDKRRDLKRRFESSKSFESAYFELFIHQLFLQQGFDITVENIVKNGRKPDFLMKKGNIEFYMELAVTNGETPSTESLENRKNDFINQLNKTKSPNFYLAIKSLKFKSKNTPKAKKVAKSILDKIQNQGTDKSVSVQWNTEPCHITYEDDDICLTVSNDLNLHSTLTDIASGTHWVFPCEAKWNMSSEEIYKSIEKKRKRYGVLDKPFFICINYTGKTGTNINSVMNLLFGPSERKTLPNITKQLLNERRSGGLFFKNTDSIYQKIFGVLVTEATGLNFDKYEYWFFKNPEVGFDFSIFDLTYSYFDNDVLKTVNNKTLGQVLNLDSD